MKSKKICLIIILLILAIGVYYLFNFYINKKNKENELNIEKDSFTENELNTEKDRSIENELNISKEILTENEAKELMQEKWDLACELYNLSDKYFDWGEEKSELETKKGEDGYTFECYKITNYHEVLEKYFTSNMYSYFENNAICLKIIDDIPYIVEGGGGFSSYDGIEEILNIQITSEKITGIIKTRLSDVNGDFLEYKENPFTLVKSGDNWLIDEWRYVD